MRQVFIGRGRAERSAIRSGSSTSSASAPKKPSANRPLDGVRLFLHLRACPPTRSSTKDCCCHIRSAAYYQDLKDSDLASALALVHSRFSTNTFPTWPLAHPYRYICHNGEINTLKGNVNWMRARQGRLQSESLRQRHGKAFPIVYEHQSDSACLDNALEFLRVGWPFVAPRDDDVDSRAMGRRIRRWISTAEDSTNITPP